MAASTATSGVVGSGVAGSGVAAGDGGATRPIRVLALGNELISDDALGVVAARELCRRLADVSTPSSFGPPPDPAATAWAFEHPRVGPIEVVETALTGMYLLDAVLGASRLVVVDTLVSGTFEPGTVLVLQEGDLVGAPGGSPHYIGLFETLELARALGLDVPAQVVIVAVEAGDYTTVGGAMTAPVEAAVPAVVERVMALVEGGPAVPA
jgi:hydrogenase maturation protease